VGKYGEGKGNMGGVWDGSGVWEMGVGGGGRQGWECVGWGWETRVGVCGMGVGVGVCGMGWGVGDEGGGVWDGGGGVGDGGGWVWSMTLLPELLNLLLTPW
jgi:hypothetical protein